MKYNENIVSCILDASRQVLASHGFEHASTTVDWRGEAVEYESSRKNMKILFEHRYDSGYCIVTWLYSYRPTLDGVVLDYRCDLEGMCKSLGVQSPVIREPLNSPETIMKYASVYMGEIVNALDQVLTQLEKLGGDAR